MITGYSAVSSVVILWLMLRYVCFLYLIRMVVFFNRCRCLGLFARYCGVNFFPCSFCCCDVFRCFVRCFSFPVVGLVLQRGCVCVCLLLGVGTVRYFVLYQNTLSKQNRRGNWEFRGVELFKTTHSCRG